MGGAEYHDHQALGLLPPFQGEKGKQKWTIVWRGCVQQRRRERSWAGSKSLRIPFDPPYLWRASLLFLAFGDLLLQHFLEAPKVNTAKFVFLQLHSAVLTAPGRERGRQVNPHRPTSLIKMLTMRAHITVCWQQARNTMMITTKCLATIIMIIISYITGGL